MGLSTIEVVQLIAAAVAAIGQAIAAGLRPDLVVAAVRHLETELATLASDVDRIADGA